MANQIERQAQRDAVDAISGVPVWNPYDPFTQPENYNSWVIAFSKHIEYLARIANE